MEGRRNMNDIDNDDTNDQEFREPMRAPRVESDEDAAPAHGDGSRTSVTLVDRLLRAPDSIARNFVVGDRYGGLLLRLILVVVACFAVFGVIVGSFSGGGNYWMAPLKIVAGIVASTAICLPSLYILSCIYGADLSLSRICGLLVQALALAGILVCGLLPVAWLFSESTRSGAFMAALHWACWLACIYVGLQGLHRAVSRAAQSHMSVIKLWSVLFVIVGFQMATYLRPIVGPANEGPTISQEKMNFIKHWEESLRRP